LQRGRNYLNLKTDGFVEKVRHLWSSYCFVGCSSYVLAQKLKALKVDLRTLNETEFSNVENNKRALLDI
jgi:hypothetical protein